MATMLTKEENQHHTLGILLNAAEDKSWKVRVCFAKQYPQFSKAFGKDISENTLVQNYCNLMTDSEPEVRNTAINSLFISLKQQLMSAELLSVKVFPTLKNELPSAQSSYKAGVALALCEMATNVGHDFANEMIVGQLMQLMQDENSELHINIVQNLKKVWSLDKTDIDDKTRAMQKSYWRNMVEKIFNQSNNSYQQWRVRVAAIELVALMSTHCTLTEYKEWLESYYLRYIHDKAASVRIEGVQWLGKLISKFPKEYTYNDLITRLEKSYHEKQVAFHTRMTILESLCEILLAIRAEADMEKVDQIFKIFTSALQEKVPNVVFCALRLLTKIK